MKFKVKIRHRNVSEEMLLDDMRRVARKLRKRKLTNSEYRIYGRFCDATMRYRFDNWNNAVKAAGLELSVNKKIKTVELFENLKEIWVKLGRQPTCMLLKHPFSKFSLSTYQKRFGSWVEALLAFEKYIKMSKSERVKLEREEVNSRKKKLRRRKSREISYYTRYTILQRDNYSCRACGRSPANERGVKLHIDHIKPISKGGGNSEENLQTLCEKCNLGKGSL